MFQRRNRFLVMALAGGGGTLALSGCTGGHIDGGEASLTLPELSDVSIAGGVSGSALLIGGLLVTVLGLAFGVSVLSRIRRLPVHASMREVSELIDETSKAYLVQ